MALAFLAFWTCGSDAVAATTIIAVDLADTISERTIIID